MTSIKGKSSRQNESYREHMTIENVLRDDSKTGLQGYTFFPHIFISCHLKKSRVLCYTLCKKKNALECPSVCPSIHPSVHQRFLSGLYFEHILTTFLQTSLGKSGLGLKMGKFHLISMELWPLIYVKISFPGSVLSIY